MVCAEVSQMTGASNRVFHQTLNAQNSMLSKEIHDQGKKDFIFSKFSRIEWYGLYSIKQQNVSGGDSSRASICIEILK